MASDDDLRPAAFGEEETADLRRQYARHSVRLVLVFALLFAGVFFALWWSGAAVRYSSLRTADRAVPSWHVTGTVRSAADHQPIPWADLQDDPAGQPPFFRTEANQFGAFDLVTFPEQHRVRVAAPGFRPATLIVGRVWFLWLPHGTETHIIQLFPE